MMLTETNETKLIPYFLDYKTHFPPQFWEETGGASYSVNVDYYLDHYRIPALKDVIKYFTTFFASKNIFLLSSSKTQVRLMVWKIQYIL